MSTQEKLERCEVCGDKKAKYTCPKCEVRTCSLTCSNIHKKELDCDGIRDKTKFLPIKSITELDLVSDYCLLQEVGRCVDKYDRDPLKRTTLNKFLPPFLRKLKYAAFKRGVTLEFLPRSFSRNRENTTRFMWNKNELLWRIDWIFPQGGNIKWTTAKASEKARLSVLVENILEPEMKTDEDLKIHSLKSILRNKLQFYRLAGLNGIKVLMKAEKVRNSSSRFYELDLNLTLSENLEQKAIIEFPTFYVILSKHSDMYEIIDSDDETEVGQEKNPQQRHKFKPNQRTIEEESKPINFLFHTEFTDSEDEKAKLEKKKNVKLPERKRKFQKSKKEKIPKKIVKARDTLKEVTGICKSDSKDEVPIKGNIQGTVFHSLEPKSLELIMNEKSPVVQKPPINNFMNSHITDSEDEGPEETPIQRLLSNENEDEKKKGIIDKNENSGELKVSNASIQSIAMNYFSAYMSDSEDETDSENTQNSSNSGLQIPEYNVLVKMNH